MDALLLTDPRRPPPTHRYCGSSSERESVGDPGHCEDCARVGHVAAHPDLGCGDVGCTSSHPDDVAEDRARAGISVRSGPGAVVCRVPATGEASDYGTVTRAHPTGYDVVWLGSLAPAFVPADQVEPW